MKQESIDYSIEEREGVVIHDNLPQAPLLVVGRSVDPLFKISQIEEKWEDELAQNFIPLLKVRTNSKEEHLLDVELVVIKPKIRTHSKDRETGRYSIPNYDPIDLDKVPVHLNQGAYFTTAHFPGIQEDYQGFYHPLLEQKMFFIIKEKIADSDRTRIRQLQPPRNMVHFLDWLHEDSLNKEAHPGVKVSQHWYSSKD